MKLSQLDLARASDAAIMRGVIALRILAGGERPSAERPTDRMALALVRALNDRRRVLAVLELDLLDDDEAEGIGPGDGPMGLSPNV